MEFKTVNITKNVFLPNKHIDIVRLLSEGNRSAKIAETLNINVRTLEKQMERIFSYHNVKTSAQLVAFYLRNKLID